MVIPGNPTIEELLSIIAAQQAQIGSLSARVAELERQLGLNSSNSGKPPSSVGLAKPPFRGGSLRERSGKEPGGQKGHPDKTLRRTETPDVTLDHFPETCSGCGASLSPAMAIDHSARQFLICPNHSR